MAGSEPGRWARDPSREPTEWQVKLGPFGIDRLPTFSGPSGEVLLHTYDDAAEYCGSRGGRLCSELEWERACKGERSQAFAGRDRADPSCWQQEKACPSEFGVEQLGRHSEWTASRSGSKRVVRGAESDAPAEQHRCAFRELVAEQAAAKRAFRCCYGPLNAARVPKAKELPTFATAETTPSELAAALEKDPATRRISANIRYFDEAAPSTVLARGSGDTQGFLFTSQPLWWSPEPGARFLVATGRSGETTSFVVVLYAQESHPGRVAASFIMEDEPGPIALAYNGYIRPRLHFSGCWGCLGETGKILHRPGDRIRISQP